MALKVDAEFEGKLTCAFKKDMKNFKTFHSLKNDQFVFRKQNGGTKSKIQNNQIDQMQCENFILPLKLINSTINITFYTCSIRIVVLKV